MGLISRVSSRTYRSKNTLKWSKESPTDADWLGTPHPTSAEFLKPPAANSSFSTPLNEVTLAKPFKALKLTGLLSFNQVEPPDVLKPSQELMEVACLLNL